MIETVRVSEKAKVQLITLKRRTGIQNWNVLCRWALCSSLAEKSEPPNEDIPSDSSIEMTWKTFTGGEEELYLALVETQSYQIWSPLRKRDSDSILPTPPSQRDLLPCWQSEDEQD